MRYWVTTVRAIDPNDKELKDFAGPNVPGLNREDAEKYCQKNGLGYLRIEGELIEEIEDNKTRPSPNKN